MMLKMIALCAIVVAATALPSTAQTTPEETFLENSFAEAKSVISSLLQSGKDQGACADLADATIKEVEQAVGAAQQTLDSLDNGDECHKEGQAEVDAAQTARDNANQAKSDADTAVAHAGSAKVEFDAIPFSDLKEGQCATFFDDAAYIAAKKAMSDAKEAAVKAAGAADAAKTALDAAEDSQKTAINACYCRVKKAYDGAWKAASENNDSNAKAYTKGKHMHCVLAGTPPADCQVGNVPEVKPRTLNSGVDSATCD